VTPKKWLMNVATFLHRPINPEITRAGLESFIDRQSFELSAFPAAFHAATITTS
jgi:hypothetical protein